MIIEGIFISLGFILAILGLCELLHTVHLATFYKKREVRLLSVIFLKPEQAVSQLMFAAEQKRWLGSDFAEYIIGVTDNLSEKELDDCKLLASKNAIILCSKDILSRVTENLVFKI